MRYQTKLSLAYATIALVLSLSLGITVYRLSLDYEHRLQMESISVTSTQLVSQMEDRLSRMDAIIYYILSDSSMLDSIETLGMVSEGTVPSSFVLNAKSVLNIGLNTEYIIRNSYRTLFYNQLGDFISSFNVEDKKLPLDGIDISSVAYCGQAEEAKGKTVLIGPHQDSWGRMDGPMVYSMMKAVQGYQTGYVEVENTVKSLESLETGDSNIQFFILTETGEVLFSRCNQELDSHRINELKNSVAEDGEIGKIENLLICKRQAEDKSFTVITFMPQIWDQASQMILFTSVLVMLLTLGISMVLILFWSYRLTKPIRTLSSMMENTNLENLEFQKAEQLGVTGGLDEVQMLGKSYQAMTERLGEAMDNERKSMMLQMQAQFDTLQAQINPHFLYNVLNIISSRGVEDDDDMICDMCGALAGMLRYSTNNKERYAQVEQEIHYLRDYLFLLQARYGERISIDFEMDSSINEEMLPKMTLHQFVENILAHGYNKTSQKMEIEVRGVKFSDRWEIHVKDNGEGLSPEMHQKIMDKIELIRRNLMEHNGNIEMEIGGMGMINTYARCYLLYGERLIFKLENGSPGMEVTLGAKYEVQEEKTDV